MKFFKGFSVLIALGSLNLALYGKVYLKNTTSDPIIIYTQGKESFKLTPGKSQEISAFAKKDISAKFANSYGIATKKLDLSRADKYFNNYSENDTINLVQDRPYGVAIGSMSVTPAR